MLHILRFSSCNKDAVECGCARDLGKRSEHFSQCERPWQECGTVRTPHGSRDIIPPLRFRVWSTFFFFKKIVVLKQQQQFTRSNEICTVNLQLPCEKCTSKQVASIPTLLKGGPNFDYRPGERLPCVRNFMLFLNFLRRIWEMFGKIENYTRFQFFLA
jgi:hypothetical protein